MYSCLQLSIELSTVISVYNTHPAVAIHIARQSQQLRSHHGSHSDMCMCEDDVPATHAPVCDCEDGQGAGGNL